MGFLSWIQTSLSFRETWRKGPVPGKFITWRRLPWLSSRVFLRTTMFQPLAKAPSMKARGRGSVRRNSMVYGSGVTISPTAVKSDERGMTTPLGGRTMRS